MSWRSGGGRACRDGARRRHRVARRRRSRTITRVRSWIRRSPATASASASLPARHARYRPHHTAVVVSARAPDEREVRLDWREFDAYVNRWAQRARARSASRAATASRPCSPNGLELLATYWACAKLGAAVVPLSPLLTATGLASLLRDATPRVVIATADDRAALDDVRDALAVRDRVGARRRGGRRRGGGLSRVRHAARGGAATPSPAPRSRPATCSTLMYTSGTTGLPEGHPAHALHPRDVRDDDGQRVADGARVGRAAFGRAGVQRRDGDDVAGVHVRRARSSCIARSTRRRSSRRSSASASRTRCSCRRRSSRSSTRRGFDPARLDVARDGALARRAAAQRAQGAAQPRCCPTASTSSTASPKASSRCSTATTRSARRGSVGVPPPFYAMRIVGEDGRDLPPGEVGEIVGRGPITMPGYYNRPS